VAELPERCENLIRLLYFDTTEPTYADVSQRLGIPVASIGPTRARCLEKLRKIFER
jgi:DNA-directed RNA polymerase specialized sigma24 family protein